MRRTGGPLLLVLAALAVLPPLDLAAGAAPAPPPAATEVRLYLPFDPSGLRMGFAVTRRVTGSCFSGSLASQGRPDAWRCNAGNAIMDPCFEGMAGPRTVLACPDAPWSADVVLLTPGSALPEKERNKGDLRKAPPWALELAGGARCEMLTGATWAVAGMRVNYGCVGGGSAAGDVDRSRPEWSIFYVPPRGTAARSVGIRVAWY